MVNNKNISIIHQQISLAFSTIKGGTWSDTGVATNTSIGPS